MKYVIYYTPTFIYGCAKILHLKRSELKIKIFN